MDSKTVTSYLRGAVIMCVMAIHFSGLYAQEYIPFHLDTIGSQVVYFFFVLSGYGVYFSLDRCFCDTRSFVKSLLSFYARRAVRIYPIFWLALLVTPFFLSWPDTWQLSLYNLGIYLGVPWLRAESFFWFISAIIQCYLLAPFLFLLLKKIKPWLFLGFTLLLTDFLIFLTIASKHYDIKIPLLPNLYPFIFFDNLLMENILLFCMGMLMPSLISRYSYYLKKTVWAGLSLAAMVFLTSFVLTMRNNVFFADSQVYFSVLAIIGIPAFCSYVIAINPLRMLPFKRFICFLGIYSYSLYLFHPLFFGFLSELGVTSFGSVSIAGVVITLLLMPLFMGICAGVEKSFKLMLAHSLKST